LRQLGLGDKRWWIGDERTAVAITGHYEVCCGVLAEMYFAIKE